MLRGRLGEFAIRRCKLRFGLGKKFRFGNDVFNPILRLLYGSFRRGLYGFLEGLLAAGAQ
jgi:hypothetical protein